VKVARRQAHQLLFALALAAAILGVLDLSPGSVPASTPPYNFETIPAEVAPVHWSPFTKPGYLRKGLRSIRIGFEMDFCSPEAITSVDHIKVVERPKTKDRPFKSAVITVYKFTPEYKQVVNEGGVYVPTCQNGARGFYRYIRLKRPVQELFIYDGSYSPPRRKWSPHLYPGGTLGRP
jgi:hypothetical protein